MTRSLSFLIVAVPGLGASLAAYGPGELGLAARLGLILPLGYAVVGILSFVMALARVLEPALMIPLLAAATVGLGYAALRRGGLHRHARAALQDLRGDPWPLALGLLIIMAIAIIVGTFSPRLNLGTSSSWRYWADAAEVADAGRIPTTVLQYGGAFPATVSKGFLNAFNGGLILLVGSDPLPVLGSLAWIGGLGMSLSLWALGRELGLRFTAVLLPILIALNPVFLAREISTDVRVYKAETFGRMVAFAAVVIGIRAVRRRDGWKDPVMAGALLGIAAGTHLIPAVVALAMLAWYALARVIIDRSLVRPAMYGLAVVAVAGVLAGAFLLLPRGDVGFQGSAGKQGYEVFGSDFDPTLYLAGGRVGPPRSSTWYTTPANLYETYVIRAVRFVPHSHRARTILSLLKFGLGVGGLVASVAMLLWFPRDLRPNGLLAWGTGAAVVVVSLWFSYRYQLFVFGRFGPRRLNDYSSIPLILVGMTLVEGGLAAVNRTRPTISTALGSTLVLATALLLLPTAVLKAPDVGRTESRLGPLQWIRDNTSCDARILASERTAGIFEALTGRVAVLEGMAPHLRPAVLAPVVSLLMDARSFFRDPVDHSSFLRANNVDYVMVIKAHSVPGYGGPIGHPNSEALSSHPLLDLTYESAAADVYRVTGPTSLGSRADVDRFPGYRCDRGPITGLSDPPGPAQVIGGSHEDGGVGDR